MSDRHKLMAFPLRFPGTMRTQLQEFADQSGRSLNAEIIIRLKQTMEMEEGTLEKIEQHLQAIRSMMEQQHKQFGPEVQQHPEAGTSALSHSYDKEAKCKQIIAR